MTPGGVAGVWAVDGVGRDGPTAAGRGMVGATTERGRGMTGHEGATEGELRATRARAAALARRRRKAIDVARADLAGIELRLAFAERKAPLRERAERRRRRVASLLWEAEVAEAEAGRAERALAALLAERPARARRGRGPEVAGEVGATHPRGESRG